MAGNRRYNSDFAVYKHYKLCIAKLPQTAGKKRAQSQSKESGSGRGGSGCGIR